MPCGNVCAVYGALDVYLLNTGMITELYTSFSFTIPNRNHITPILVTFETKKAQDLPSLVRSLNFLAKQFIDFPVTCDDCGLHILHATDEDQLEELIESLASTCSCELSISQPSVLLCETVSSVSEMCTSISPNKQNRVYMKALPLESDVIDATEYWVHTGYLKKITVRL